MSAPLSIQVLILEPKLQYLNDTVAFWGSQAVQA